MPRFTFLVTDSDAIDRFQTVSSYWRPQNYPHAVSLQRILKPHSIHTSEMNPQLVNKLFLSILLFLRFCMKASTASLKAHIMYDDTHLQPRFSIFPAI